MNLNTTHPCRRLWHRLSLCRIRLRPSRPLPAEHLPAPDIHALAPRRDSYQFFDTLVDLRSQILHNYVEPVDDDKLLNGAIKGMLAELDPYSNYFTKDELANFDLAVHGQFSGIGVEISQDPATGNFIILSPLEDSPALKAGALPATASSKSTAKPPKACRLKELLTQNFRRAQHHAQTHRPA